MKKLCSRICAKPRTFALTYWKSLTKPSYYKDILDAKFSFSFKYFISLLYVSFLIVAVGVSIRVLTLIPKVPKFTETTKTFFVETYPKELKLSLKEGKIKTNVKEPYFINLADSQKASIEPFDHLLTIDTKAEAGTIKTFDSLLLLTGNNLVISGGTESANYKEIPLGDILAKISDGASLDKPSFILFLDKYQPYALKTLPKVIVSISLLILILYAPIRGIMSLISQGLLLIPLSFILFVVAKIAKRKISFSKMYQMSLHGATIPVTLTFLFGFWGYYQYLSIFSWIAFFVFMIVVIFRQNSLKAS